MRVFLDSSAFAKRYVREEGTDVVLALCDQATELCLSAIALPELISAFCRLQREGRLSSQQYTDLKMQLMEDVVDVAVSDLTPAIIRYSMLCLEQNRLRAMDAIHVGSAIALEAEIFVSADARQCTAAQQAGLKVVTI